ncbi:phospholipase D-like domain-containing protein [Rhizobium mayense]|uniref:phospholipase D n=1 Tax=Rhizobium mayense TaxID=1312184 RepID=A0ABT7K3D7_9HYPH|nr:phospholipase D-like domain-containing protein [Rhizobium mayense]MDL2403102.1 phospholipase D-like domain-containing protein [Rhizobium mayense]
MPKVTNENADLSVSAYAGDAKVMLAFDLKTPQSRRKLAGFTIEVTPQGHPSYYLYNNLSFEIPANHAQIATEPVYSTANAPIHKFRWVHVPGLDHQGLNPPFANYSYRVTPRYFDDNQHMLALDDGLGVSVTIPLQPFHKQGLRLGFTRGFVQSQAFLHHFGENAPIRPHNQPLVYDTNAVAGQDRQGNPFTYEQQYRWLGFTARERIREILDAIKGAPQLSLDVFAYDLDEPGIISDLLELGPTGRVRIILDNADLHHDPSDPTLEDEFAEAFAAKAGAGKILRGRFGRFAHDKIFIVYQSSMPMTVLTGSTNFSVTGIYVNSNHVIVFEDADVATLYARVFDEVWTDKATASHFAASPLAAQAFPFATATVPRFDVSFSPRRQPVALARLNEIVDRCRTEARDHGNVFFAVMELRSQSPNPVYEALTNLHADPNLFSYGISDSPKGISLYPVGAGTGVLVTGKPGSTALPPPFDQVPHIGSGHQIHHKFVVCGFGGTDPVVYCGSSNLALVGEQVNGDNLLCIHDADVVTAFTIEALLLVDHFNFLDSMPKEATSPSPPADKRSAAQAAGWHLSTTDAWAQKYFDPADLHCRDRQLFA